MCAHAAMVARRIIRHEREWIKKFRHRKIESFWALDPRSIHFKDGIFSSFYFVFSNSLPSSFSTVSELESSILSTASHFFPPVFIKECFIFPGALWVFGGWRDPRLARILSHRRKREMLKGTQQSITGLWIDNRGTRRRSFIIDHEWKKEEV